LDLPQLQKDRLETVERKDMSPTDNWGPFKVIVAARERIQVYLRLYGKGPRNPEAKNRERKEGMDRLLPGSEQSRND
jgi:hypothetical protein